MSVAVTKNISAARSPKQAARLGRALVPSLCQAHIIGVVYPAFIHIHPLPLRRTSHPQSTPFAVGTRSFSTTKPHQLRAIFPRKDTPFVRTTPPAWPHPGYTEEELLAVTPGHREPKTMGDWVAWKLVRIARYEWTLESGGSIGVAHRHVQMVHGPCHGNWPGTAS
jgi:hypothetical protein